MFVRSKLKRAFEIYKIPDFIWICGFVLLATALFFKVYYYLPVDLNDESYYLAQGQKGDYNFSWGYLYAKFYSILFLFSQDFFFIYKLGFFLVSFIFLPLSVFLLAKKLFESNTYAAILFFLCLFSSANIPTIPKIQIFNTVFLILIFLILLRQTLLSFLISFLLFFLSVYCRQDNILMLPFFAIYLWHYRKENTGFCLNKIYPKYRSAFLFIVPLVIFLTFLLIKSPFDSSRTLNAFFDHFSWYGSANKMGIVAPSLDYIRNEIFRNPQSIFDVVLGNFSAMKVHLKNNFQILFQNKNAFGLIFSRQSPSSWMLFLVVSLLFFLLGNSQNRSEKSNISLFLLFYVFILIKSLSISFLLSPQTRYLVDLIFLTPIALGSIGYYTTRFALLVKIVSSSYFKVFTFIGFLLFFFLYFLHMKMYPLSKNTIEKIGIFRDNLISTNFLRAENLYFHNHVPVYLGNTANNYNQFWYIEWKKVQPKDKNSMIDFFIEKNIQFVSIPKDLGIGGTNYYGIDLSLSKFDQFLLEKNCRKVDISSDINQLVYDCYEADWNHVHNR